MKKRILFFALLAGLIVAKKNDAKPPQPRNIAIQNITMPKSWVTPYTIGGVTVIPKNTPLNLWQSSPTQPRINILLGKTNKAIFKPSVKNNLLPTVTIKYITDALNKYILFQLEQNNNESLAAYAKLNLSSITQAFDDTDMDPSRHLFRIDLNIKDAGLDESGKINIIDSITVHPPGVDEQKFTNSDMKINGWLTEAPGIAQTS